MKSLSKITFATFITFSTLLFTSPGQVAACSCLQQTVSENVENADVVFSGTVEAVSSQIRVNSPFNNTEESNTANFLIDESFKGVEKDREFIKVTAETLSSCGTKFSNGDSWLIFANYDQSDELRFSICGGSSLLSEPGEQGYEQQQKYLSEVRLDSQRDEDENPDYYFPDDYPDFPIYPGDDIEIPTTAIYTTALSERIMLTICGLLICCCLIAIFSGTMAAIVWSRRNDKDKNLE